MERIRALINKLHEQSEQNADASVLTVTVQMLQAELAQRLASTPKQVGTSKVAVMMPSSNKVAFALREDIDEPVKQPAYMETAKKVTESAKRITENEFQTPENKKQDQSRWLFDPMDDVPTLAHQKQFREMNDVFGEKVSSLNDRLKTEKKELATVLTEGPVRDLKKAIGINDRFVFLSELFRGDEAMYERSLKTINNFRIYPEAEYWIERELKVKLGWDENKETVKHFRHLVRRRFT
ncbi:MAG: hypothetical protein ABIN89_10615 [Chitinophagaceae bacterium]